MMSQIARRTRVPLVYCNLVGGNDDLVFDGAIDSRSTRGADWSARPGASTEDFWTIDLPGRRGDRARGPNRR